MSQVLFLLPAILQCCLIFPSRRGSSRRNPIVTKYLNFDYAAGTIKQVTEIILRRNKKKNFMNNVVSTEVIFEL